MKDFIDRIPTLSGRRKITHEDGTSEYVTMEMADEPVKVGTPLNRSTFMELQGFAYAKTVFNADGSIDEINSLGEVLHTVFNADGSISETFTNKDGLSIKITTTFNADGSITTDLVDI